jgi:hypothetical protein
MTGSNVQEQNVRSGTATVRLSALCEASHKCHKNIVFPDRLLPHVSVTPRDTWNGAY